MILAYMISAYMILARIIFAHNFALLQSLFNLLLFNLWGRHVII